MKVVIVLLAVFMVVAGGVAAADYTADVVWNAGQPLTWSDFCGLPPQTPTAEAAMIAMRISWRVAYTITYDPLRQMWSGTIDRAGVTVANTMDPRASWVRPGAATTALLDHEQHHFDLNEVYARMLVSALIGLSASGTTKDAVDTQLRQLIAATGSRILGALKVMQRGYDDQTGHGTRRGQQHTWDEQIAAWLRASGAAPTTAGDARAFLSSKMATGG